ncbi:MAG: sulfotransferase [Bacteroidia bacterium]|nr:sulfotransferase [Bacteroidia bacterium]
MYIDKEEFEARSTGKHGYDLSAYDFLTNLNLQLEGLEKKLQDKDVTEEYSNIFILGLPRSGTTLISQLIFNHLDLACVNNLVARFWDAPLTGTYLSKIVLNDTKSFTYSSKYAATDSIVSPHEFAYFWRKHFLSSDVTTSYPPERDALIDWKNVQNIILNMNRIMQKGFVFKTLEITGFYIDRFMKLFPKSIFVYIKRDNEDVAVSIAKARLDHYNTLDRWWATYPLEYNLLADKNYADQIAGQIFYLKKMFDAAVERHWHTNRIIIVEYKDMCADPNKLLGTISGRVKELFKIELQRVGEAPLLEFSKPAIADEIRTSLNRSLSEYF